MSALTIAEITHRIKSCPSGPELVELLAELRRARHREWGTGRVLDSRIWHKKHLYTLRKMKEARDPALCVAPDCYAPPARWKRGLCEACYQRYRRAGELELVANPPARPGPKVGRDVHMRVG